jgi:hypothetical protein
VGGGGGGGGGRGAGGGGAGGLGKSEGQLVQVRRGMEEGALTEGGTCIV